MAEEYNRAMGGNRWWDSSTASSSSSSSSSSMVFPDQSSLQMMGLGLSSQPMEDHMRGGFRSILQEGMTYGSSNPEFKSIKGLSPAATFSVDQFSHTSSVDSCSHGGLPSPSFLTPLESSSSGIFQPLIMNNSDHHHQQQSGFGYHQANYGNSESLIMGNSPNWSSNKVIPEVPQFLKANSNQPQFINNHGSFWNPATSMGDPRPAAFFPVEVAPPLLQPPQLAVPSFHDKPNKNNMDQVRTTSGGGRKTPSGSDRTSTTTTVSTTSSSGGATKRSRNEASSNLPPFKVRKEKMGDRITALQQLVSPFGKTDTASVLSEAIEYIKFLHEQVNVLSTPYLKSGASLQHQQGHDKFKDQDAPRQDLRTRGLCLVPVSSTFPVAHESTVDFWTPGYGSGAFR